MPYVSSKTSVATAKIPTIATWKCSKCGKINTVSHTLTIQGQADAFGLTSDLKVKLRAEQDLRDRMGRAFQKFKTGDLRAAKLKSPCAGCGHKEVWATHIKNLNWGIMLLLAFLGIGLFMVMSNLPKDERPIPFVISLILFFGPFLTAAVIALINLVKVDKTRKLPKENRPTLLLIRTKPGTQPSAAYAPQTKDFPDPGAGVPAQPDTWTYPDASRYQDVLQQSQTAWTVPGASGYHIASQPEQNTWTDPNANGYQDASQQGQNTWTVPDAGGYQDASQQGQNTWTAPGRNGKAYSSGGTRKGRIRDKIVIWGGTLLVAIFAMGFLNANPTLKSFSPLVLFVAVVIVAPALCRLRDRQNGC